MASKNNQNLWLGIVTVLIVAGIGWAVFRDAGEPVQQAAVNAPGVHPQQAIDNTGGETMDPARFTDAKTKDSYAAAKEIPDVLKELPCFCGCMVAHGHKNNLFCFMDEHGSSCLICQDIALDARTMRRNGASVNEIQDSIRMKYAQYAP